jgi:hypothetical protein
MKLLSANDETLGILLGMNPSIATVFIPSLQKMMTISATSGENTLLAFDVFFTEPGCAGSPFAIPGQNYHTFIMTYRIGSESVNQHYLISQQTESVHVRSLRHASSPYNCESTDQTDMFQSLTPVALPFTYPVALPLHLEYE